MQKETINSEIAYNLFDIPFNVCKKWKHCTQAQEREEINETERSSSNNESEFRIKRRDSAGIVCNT